MIKQTFLLAVSLVGLLVAPVAVPQRNVGLHFDGPTQPAHVTDIPAPETVQELEPMVVSVARPKAHLKATSKVWTCGGWQDSRVGGSYRACEWM